MSSVSPDCQIGPICYDYEKNQKTWPNVTLFLRKIKLFGLIQLFTSLLPKLKFRQPDPKRELPDFVKWKQPDLIQQGNIHPIFGGSV